MSNNNTQSQSIDSLIDTLAKNPDLRSDVLPFLMPTLVKLKQMASFLEGKKSDNYSDYYEFNQICNNYLPTTVNSFCAIPIEMRNTKKMKNSLTARDLLIEQLKNLIKQVDQVESNLMSNEEKSFLANHQYLKGKIESTGLSEETGVNLNFQNKFNFDEYAKTPESQNNYVIQSSGDHHGANQIDKNAALELEAKAQRDRQALKKQQRLDTVKIGALKTKQFVGMVYNNIRHSGEEILKVGALVFLASTVGLGMTKVIRYENNTGDMRDEFAFVLKSIGDQKDFTKPELEALATRVKTLHEDKIGDYTSLVGINVGEDNTLTLRYTVKHACSALTRNLFGQFIGRDLNSVFTVGGTEYVMKSINNNEDFKALRDYVYNNTGGSWVYENLIEKIKSEKNQLDLSKDPTFLPMARNGLNASTNEECQLDEVDLTIKLSPNEPVPAYAPTKKAKM